ncbi:TIGR03668 family PPOX class F420-dependent oxidoreductase [Streptomyces sp. RB6PN25]|uniref:TIGR03668 family PPOX class F420-dependent oxidoreductase n=1 Tax=Streptomyces humicola TaxID=2953240 RepID=A0ABT1PVT3_9ACTN|nr:TIGR03668 family PPOX class F420-dependent oxidoreductase [Streptomyces humicola]MCQ4081778.1 TIGR03668 family PPOX class F420-dependent oxidoreductase [Streptomyces humicola]
MRLGLDESRRRFEAARVARLATSSARGLPHAVPVTFALDDATLYFAVDHKPKRTHDLRRLRNIGENPQVAVLADHYADDWTALWWVRADGHAVVVDDEAQRDHAIGLLRAKYPQYREQPPNGPVVAITVTRWSGWCYA